MTPLVQNNYNAILEYKAYNQRKTLNGFLHQERLIDCNQSFLNKEYVKSRADIKTEAKQGRMH